MWRAASDEEGKEDSPSRPQESLRRPFFGCHDKQYKVKAVKGNHDSLLTKRKSRQYGRKESSLDSERRFTQKNLFLSSFTSDRQVLTVRVCAPRPQVGPRVGRTVRPRRNKRTHVCPGEVSSGPLESGSGLPKTRTKDWKSPGFYRGRVVLKPSVEVLDHVRSRLTAAGSLVEDWQRIEKSFLAYP